MRYLLSVAIDASGDVFVVNGQSLSPYGGAILEYDSSLNYVREISSGSCSSCSEPYYLAVAAGGGHLYALTGGPTYGAYFGAPGGAYTLDRFTPPYSSNMTPDETKTFTVGSGAGDLASHYGDPLDQIAVDPSGGTVYVTDAANKRVIELNSSLTPLTPTLTGFTGYPLAIASGSAGGSSQVYVSDGPYSTLAGGSTVLRRYSPDGALLGSLTAPAAASGLAQDGSGNLFVAEGSGGSVLRIDTTPDPAIGVNPASSLTGQTVTFSGSQSPSLWGAADYSWNVGGATYDTGPSPTFAHQFNTAGTYPVSLTIRGTNGRSGTTKRTYSVANSSASFAGPPTSMSGQSVTFDASTSAIPYSTVTNYAWDFDGSSSYSQSTGTSPTITHVFQAGGHYEVQLRVTRSGGVQNLATGYITVLPAPPAGPVGVAIDHSAYATNTPNVELNIIWPMGATHAMISNDGAFDAAGNTKIVALTRSIPWTLRSKGSEYLPKFVYVRFTDGPTGLQEFTGNIILDTRTPVVQSATVLAAARDTAGAAWDAFGATVRTYSVTLRAAESVSGIARAEIARRPVHHRLRWLEGDPIGPVAGAAGSADAVVDFTNPKQRGILRLDRVIPVTMSSPPLWVRVQSAAGTWSAWHRIT